MDVERAITEIPHDTNINASSGWRQKLWSCEAETPSFCPVIAVFTG